jgi:hypothetical protein
VPRPGGTGTFTAFPTDPAQSLDVTALTGSGSGGQQGVYACDRASPTNPCRVLADTATAIPGGAGLFTGFLAPGISGDWVAFTAAGTDGQQGVYACDAMLPTDPCRVLADTLTEIPGGAGTFTGFQPIDPCAPAVSGTLTAFYGAGNGGQQGIYACDQTLAGGLCDALVDTDTTIPAADGVGTFQSFERLALDEVGNLAFVGGGMVTFGGGDTELTLPVKGVYTLIGGVLAGVADLFTAIPEGIGNFSDFGAVAMDPGQVVFVGYGSGGQKGLYTDWGGPLAKVIAVGDALDGKTVSDLSLGAFGFSGGQLAFRASFDDGSQAVTTAGLCAELGFEGFLPPIGGADASGGSASDPVATFKLKSTVPVKMRLACGGVPVATGTHTLKVAKVNGATSTDPAVDATPTDAATTGNAFRLTDAATGEWHFNVNTKGLSKGTWEVTATLSDGSVHSAFIGLK